MNYRILILDRGIILGYRSTEKKAVELALQQADQLKASIEVQKRNARGEYEQFTIALNPEKFVSEEGDIIW
jgi:hypothetical protein